MANDKIVKDWRVTNIDDLKRKIEKFRKIAFTLMPLGMILLVSLFFVPFKIGLLWKALWFLVSLGFSLGWYLSHSIKIVKAWEIGVIFRNGAYHREVCPGLRLLLWPFDSIKFVKTYEIKIDPDDQEVFTKELIRESGKNGEEDKERQMPAMLDIVFWGKVFGAAESIINVENLNDAALNIVLGVARVIVSGMSFDEVNKSKESVARRIMENANELFGGWGYQITKLQVRHVKPSPEILKAQESIQVANKKREATKIDAEVRAEVMAILDKADPDMKRRALQALEGFKGSINILGRDVPEIIGNLIGGSKK